MKIVRRISDMVLNELQSNKLEKKEYETYRALVPPPVHPQGVSVDKCPDGYEGYEQDSDDDGA